MPPVPGIANIVTGSESAGSMHAAATIESSEGKQSVRVDSHIGATLIITGTKVKQD